MNEMNDLLMQLSFKLSLLKWGEIHFYHKLDKRGHQPLELLWNFSCTFHMKHNRKDLMINSGTSLVLSWLGSCLPRTLSLHLTLRNGNYNTCSMYRTVVKVK